MSINNILAKKIGSTTIFKDGESKHATILKSGPCTVTQIKNKKVDGYSAIQLGFEPAKNLNKPLTGHLVKTKSKFRTLKEFRVSDDILNKVGDSINVSIFSKGQYLNITAKSKGRGFTGTVKRWNFKGGPKTHGQSDRHRAPGSIGAGSTPGKVVKGKKMAGRYGGEQFTIKNLEILEIDLENNLLYVSGSVPGATNTLVSISASNKAFTPYEEPKAEEPKTEEPKTEEPKTEEPKTEEPKTEEPKAEEPKAEEPKAEDKNKGEN
jgi:large subunit ribosomal protein L3